MSTNLKRIVEKQGFKIIDSPDFADAILYKKWYKGFDSDFHISTFLVNNESRTCELKSSKLGRMVAGEWASLLKFTEAEIKLQNQEHEQKVKELFIENDSIFKMAQFMETVIALGFGCTVNVKDLNGSVKTRYLSPSEFNVIQINGDKEVTGIAVPFLDYMYMEYEVNGKTEIKVFPVHKTTASKIEYNETPTQTVISPYRNFNIFQNALAPKSNEHLFSPSVLDSAIDYIKAFDKTFNEMLDEFDMSRKRIFVSSDLIRTEFVNEQEIQYLDMKDRVFQVMPNMSLVDNKPITEVDFNIRSEKYLSAMYTLLNLVSFSSHLGSNYFSFTADDGSINYTTASQVISNNSETYRHLKKFELSLENQLRKWLRSLLYLYASVDINLSDVSVNFDDSITKDDASERKMALSEVQAGVRSPYSYLTEVLNRSETEANEELERIGESKETEVASPPQNLEENGATTENVGKDDSDEITRN